MKKTIINIFTLIALALTVGSCSDFLDRENPSYDAEGFYTTESGLKEGVTGIYPLLYFDMNWAVPACIVLDHYTAYGLEQDENSSIGAGGTLNPDNGKIQTFWSGEYKIVARANSVISGASGKIEQMSENAKQYYSEARVLRAYAYYNLVSAFGDVPFFTAPVTIDQYTVGRTSKHEILKFLIADLKDAANSLPWVATERGRVDKAVAYGLIGRIGLLGGSFDIDGKGTEYFREAADATALVIGKRNLANKFEDLFNLSGQAKSDVRNELLMELMYSSNGTKKTHTVSYGHSSRNYASSVRFPSQIIADTYECIDGLRIDESPLYNPKKPTENRDPRFNATLSGHGDTINYTNTDGSFPLKMILNIYDEKTKFYPRRDKWYTSANVDVTTNKPSVVNNGIGYLWRKYANENTEQLMTQTCNIILMRYAEVLLTYAEAKIELNELDESVYNAINLVRKRAEMPVVADSKKGNQQKMRQLVRRERKVELVLEGLLFVDVRRWGIGDMLNDGPTYGQPLPTIKYEGLEATDIPNFKLDDRHDLNDIPSYEAYKEKLRVRDKNRFWAPRFMWWPIPRLETDRDPNLTNPEY
ncbi:MAG: RagB/SusD family nutrient uptake outer membrane protein [Muribaculaceae bacterium]|nr:RagB/SusD family nutrient uptake outer membrane protein [Muribaculaceae bacterium]